MHSDSPQTTIGTGSYDVIIIGAGPAGTTAALKLVRAGYRPVLFEKTVFPRFKIGESFLPRNFNLLQELGLVDSLRALPHVPKFGAEFGFCDSAETIRFSFSEIFAKGKETFSIERSHFDQMMLNEVRKAGVEVHEGTAVRKILRLEDGDVRVATDAGEFAAKYLIDASGQGSVVARHLGTFKPLSDPDLQKIAYFAHFERVERVCEPDSGHPSIFMADEGWFWVIPLSQTKTSVGLVMDARIARTVGVKPERMLAWGLERCPILRQRMHCSTGPEKNQVLADFTYRNRPYAGPGHFLTGDAAVFIDPIFSSGVCVAMMSGYRSAELIDDMITGRMRPEKARKIYTKYLNDGTSEFFKLIRKYYQHSFREVLVSPKAPPRVKGAVLAVLAGHVFPKPSLRMKWNLRLFDLAVSIQAKRAIVPRQKPYSLLTAKPEPLPWMSGMSV